MATDSPGDPDPGAQDNEDDESVASDGELTEHADWTRPMKFGIDMSPIYRSIMPTIDFSPIYRQTKFGIDTSAIFRAYMPQPTFDTSAILRPFRTANAAGLFSGIVTANRRLSHDFYSGLTRKVEELRREHLRRASLPSNLSGIPGLTSEDVLDFTEKHAVSLYLVAPTNVALSLLNAKDTNAVRRILGDRRAAILATCARLLAQCDSPKTAVVRTAAQQAIAAMENDLYYPAQAIAGTIVDRLVDGNDLTPELCDAARRRWGEPPTAMRARLADLDKWEGYIAAALWAAFQHYKRNRGKAPASFTRHGTVHALGTPQYSRRSAVQGIMVATSAIAYVNGLS